MDRLIENSGSSINALITAVRKDQTAPVASGELAPIGNPASRSEPEANLLAYWRMLNRRRGTLILIAAVGAVLGFLTTLPQTRIYQVRTSLEIVGLNQNFLHMKDADPLSEGGSSVDSSDIQTQIKILQSDSLIDSVMLKLVGDADTDAKNPGPSAGWRLFLNLPAPQAGAKPLTASERAFIYAKLHTKVRAAGLTRMIEITVESPDADHAATYANTLTSEFIEQNLEARWKTTEKTGKWLTLQLDDMRIRLEQAEDRLQAYAREANLVFTDNDKNNVSDDKLRQVQEALSAAQTNRIAKQSRFEMAGSSAPETLPDILDDPALRDDQTKLTDLERQLAELRATFTSDEPKVKRLQLQIISVQGAFDRTRADILQRIKNEYDEAQRRESLLATSYAGQRGVVTGEGEKAVHYNILKREVESSRQLYDAMLQQLKQASLAAALRASNIRVVDPAKPKHRPYKPNVLMSLALGLLSGLMMGAAFVIMHERADRTIQDPGESVFFLNVPELGIVPSYRSAGQIRVRLVGSRAAEPDPSTPDAGVKADRKGVELVTWQHKPSLIAESFRATLVSILFSADSGGHPRVMVVTSGSPSEGKSTVVSNLGIAIAEVNQKTLLIDADLRRPSLHRIFGLKSDSGLSDLLKSKDPIAALQAGAIQETQIPNLYVLTAGSKTNAATSLLYSNRMLDLLANLRSEFDTVLIDTPPMLQIPDARVLGRMADKVIVVIRAGKTSRDAAMAACQRFAEDGTQILGTILNDWNRKRSLNGAYYGGGYYSGYGAYGGYGSSRSNQETPEVSNSR